MANPVFAGVDSAGTYWYYNPTTNLVTASQTAPDQAMLDYTSQYMSYSSVNPSLGRLNYTYSDPASGKTTVIPAFSVIPQSVSDLPGAYAKGQSLLAMLAPTPVTNGGSTTTTTTTTTTSSAATTTSSSSSTTTSTSTLPTTPTTASAARLAAAGLNPGAATSTATTASSPSVTVNGASGMTNQDWRIKLSVSPTSGIFGGSSNTFLAPLINTVGAGSTLGVTFPYVPSISVQHNAKYGSQDLIHANYTSYYYKGSDISQISIQSEFTVQNVDEGQYLVAAIQFFRSVTKMFWGQDTNPSAGNPPPIVFLDGYGDFYFPHVTCVVTQFQHSMDPNTDYVEVPLPGMSQKTAWVPAISTITAVVQPVYSRQNLFNNFTLDQFSKGQLLGKGFI